MLGVLRILQNYLLLRVHGLTKVTCLKLPTSVSLRNYVAIQEFLNVRMTTPCASKDKGEQRKITTMLFTT